MLNRLKQLLFKSDGNDSSEESYLHIVCSDKNNISFVLKFQNKRCSEEMVLTLLKVNHSKGIHLQVVLAEDTNDVEVSVHFYEQDLSQAYTVIQKIAELESEIKSHGENN
jgi:hypothetical protein